MAKKQEKNSLVANINKRKRAGTSRPRSRSTISREAYREMEEGWPQSKRRGGARKTGAKKTGARKTGARKTGAARASR